MTILSEQTVNCCVCGAAVTFSVVVSTIYGGMPDLDMRPPPMARSLVRLEVRACPACGYCAADIAQGPPEAVALVRDAAYEHLRDDTTYPPVANRFLRQAFILEATGETSAAGWAALRAAWCCDDGLSRDAAINCRIRALDLFLRGLDAGQQIKGEAGSQQALLADIARRAELYHEAKILCRQGLARQPQPPIVRILNFQRTLAEEEDPTGYNLRELPRAREATPRPTA